MKGTEKGCQEEKSWGNGMIPVKTRVIKSVLLQLEDPQRNILKNGHQICHFITFVTEKADFRWLKEWGEKEDRDYSVDQSLKN